MKKIVILGSTGSIGRQTSDVVRVFPEDFDVVGLAAGTKQYQRASACGGQSLQFDHSPTLPGNVWTDRVHKRIRDGLDRLGLLGGTPAPLQSVDSL